MQRQPLAGRSNHTSGPFGGPAPCRAARLWVRVTAAAERTAQQARQPSLSATTHSQPASTPVCNNVVGTGYSRPGSRAARGRKVGTRLRVAVDVDEVLGRFLHSLNKYCLEEYGLEYDLADYSEYDFAKVWKCTLDIANQRVHEFFRSHHFAVGILPIPGALHSLQRLGQHCDLVVVTSRQHVIQQTTTEWIALHFPGVFQELYFCNHWALEGASRKKSDVCSEIGARVLIDDNPRYAVECAEAGMDVLLYDWRLGYPWSKTADGPSHPLIRRVEDWAQVEDAVALIARKY